jgi:hypothetical protein
LTPPRIVELQIGRRDLDVRVDSNHAGIALERDDRGLGQTGRDRRYDPIGALDLSAGATHVIEVARAGVIREEHEDVDSIPLLRVRRSGMERTIGGRRGKSCDCDRKRHEAYDVKLPQHELASLEL